MAHDETETRPVAAPERGMAGAPPPLPSAPPTPTAAMAGATVPTTSTGLIDLAARRLGGMVLEASDEFFAAKDNLLDPAPPAYDDTRYSDRGKVMDGWETRRRRGGGDDWCIVRLGTPGVIEAVMVDTTHFRGNYPDACSMEGCVSDGAPPDADTQWFPLLDRRDLRGDAAQRFELEAPWRVTHVRFWIHPDGGVARLRLLGRPLVDLHRASWAGRRLDLAASVNGGRAVGCSDEFFSSPHNLIAVGDARDMADGWETKRRRGAGEDWAVIELTATGVIERVELDTTHFKGNFPHRFAIDVLDAPATPTGAMPDDGGVSDGGAVPDAGGVSDGGAVPVAGGERAGGEGRSVGWVPLLEPTPTQPHFRHVFVVPDAPPATHLRLRIIPDGGVARLRAFGTITDDGWRRAGLRGLNALTPDAATDALLTCCGSKRWAREVASRRPFVDPDDLAAASDEVWGGLAPEDWLEAFGAHPRIGERASSRWSSQEQSGATDADADIQRALLEGNQAYEERFGHVFLIRATGRSASEMLDALRERLANDPETELQIAADQQAEITRLRLDKLLREGADGPQGTAPKEAT